MNHLGTFLLITIGLTLGLSVAMSTAYRATVRANWDAYRCDPGVVLTAAAFKPPNDPRSDADFARANASYCKKEYVQAAVRAAAAGPQALAAAQRATVGLAKDTVDDTASVFMSVWGFCHTAYASFMDNMKVVAHLAQNFMIQLYSIVQRLQTSVLAIVFSLIALITAFISSVQLVLVVAIVIIGILIALQIILFFLLLPISGLIVTMTALISVVVIAVGTAIAAATVAELFDGQSAACFAAGTRVELRGHATRALEDIRIGDVLRDGGRVTAIHRFDGAGIPVFCLRGIYVTGDHLLASGVPVREVPEAVVAEETNALFCLTTTSRRIPVRGPNGSLLFADWEEIAEDDEERQEAWFRAVWTRLNGPGSLPLPPRIDGDAGLAPSALIATPYGPRAIRSLSIGDVVMDGPASVARVVGVTEVESNMEDNVFAVGDTWATGGTWITREEGWTPLGAVGAAAQVDTPHFTHFVHLYTTSGAFSLANSDIRVRDASEVGLGALQGLVAAIVTKNPSSE